MKGYPILKKIEDITAEDLLECKIYNGTVTSIRCSKALILVDLETTDRHGNKHTDTVQGSTPMVDWLDLKGFDIRGWIQEGLAIDAKEVT